MQKCLVVEDIDLVRRINEVMMGRLNFEVAVAMDGAMALEMCKRSLPDVILLDWLMPKMGGLTFLKELRRIPGGDKPKIVMCTISEDDVHINMALSAGVDEYITKPYNFTTLSQKLENIGLFQTSAVSLSSH